MIAFLLATLLLSCVSKARSVAKSEKGPLQLVQNVLDYSNAYLMEHGLQHTPLPDFYHKNYSSWFRLTNGKLGELSSLKLLPGSTLDKVKDKNGGGFVFSYNLTLGLGNFRLIYDSALSLFEQSPMYGTFDLTAGVNSFDVRGTAEIGSGYCYVQLQSARTLTMGQIYTKSNTSFSPELAQKYVIDFMVPHVQSITDNVFISFKLSPLFRAYFEDTVCHVISK